MSCKLWRERTRYLGSQIFTVRRTCNVRNRSRFPVHKGDIEVSNYQYLQLPFITDRISLRRNTSVLRFTAFVRKAWRTSLWILKKKMKENGRWTPVELWVSWGDGKREERRGDCGIPRRGLSMRHTLKELKPSPNGVIKIFNLYKMFACTYLF